MFRCHQTILRPIFIVWRYINVGLKMVSLMTPKHVAKTMYYWPYIDVMFWLNKILYECRIIRLFLCFGRTCCFHLQGDWIKFRWVWSDWEREVDIYTTYKVYIYCVYVCPDFARIMANNCYRKEKGKGERIYWPTISASLSVLLVKKISQALSLCHKLRYSYLKRENFNCVLFSLTFFWKLWLVVNVQQILQGCTVAHPRRQ